MCFVMIEDELSEAIVLKLLENKGVDVEPPLRQGGFGYLRKNVEKFCNAAKNGRNVFMLTDLDQKQCAPSLIADWFKDIKKPDRFLFRVVVRESEAWLMADRKGFSNFLNISQNKIQSNIEDILHPKELLLKLAVQIKDRNLRDDLVKKEKAVAVQGLGYNKRLSEFVSNHWCPVRASENSPSLKKAIIRIEAWASDISTQKVH
jgi:hypothetical protein